MKSSHSPLLHSLDMKEPLSASSRLFSVRQWALCRLAAAHPPEVQVHVTLAVESGPLWHMSELCQDRRESRLLCHLTMPGP